MWYFGFLICVGFQALGSVISLSFISPVILGPLGSAGLVFNIFFSNLFLGTPITRRDITGTVFIVLGCILCSIFGASAPDERRIDWIRRGKC